MLIKRTILNHILNEIKKNLSRDREKKKPVIILYGPRQSGKTTLLKQILKEYYQEAQYYDCDFPDVRELFSYERSHKLEKLTKDLTLLILDEAQRIENIGLVLKILVDHHPHVQVVATGSSSFELSNRINEPLTGRKREFHLFPLSYEEFTDELGLLESQRNLDSFLRFGMYPAIALQNQSEGENNLKELTGSYLFKDIFIFQQLKKPELLTRLLRLVAFQIGSEVSYHELAIQLSVDQTVIQRYIHLLESAFVIFRLSAFRRNLRSEVARSRKIYFWDLGIRNTLINNFNVLELRNDTWALFENFCIAERLKYLNNHNILANSYFWRTYQGKEIDYLEEAKGELNTFEFKYSPSKRHKIPKEFLEEYKPKHFCIIDKENLETFLRSSRA